MANTSEGLRIGELAEGVSAKRSENAFIFKWSGKCRAAVHKSRNKINTKIAAQGSLRRA
jgi:hypothetical protein